MSEQQQAFRVKVVTAFLTASYHASKKSSKKVPTRSQIEEICLTLFDKHVSVIFGEALAIILCFVEKDWTIEQIAR